MGFEQLQPLSSLPKAAPTMCRAHNPIRPSRQMKPRGVRVIAKWLSLLAQLAGRHGGRAPAAVAGALARARSTPFQLASEQPAVAVATRLAPSVRGTPSLAAAPGEMCVYCSSSAHERSIRIPTIAITTPASILNTSTTAQAVPEACKPLPAASRTMVYAPNTQHQATHRATAQCGTVLAAALRPVAPGKLPHLSSSTCDINTPASATNGRMPSNH